MFRSMLLTTSPYRLVVPAILALLPLPSFSADRVNIAEDDASHSAYNGGWNSDMNSGSGFGSWVLRLNISGQNDSHAGFFVGDKSTQGELDNAAPNGRALAMYANGISYEAAVAFRTLNEALKEGDSFSLLMETDDFKRKFESDDSRPGSVGFSLRSGQASESWDDFQVGERLRVSADQGETNYQIKDGEDSADSGVPITAAGISVAVTLVGPDTYDLEITPLDSKETTKLAGRKLGGDAGAPIESFSIFDIDGEYQDAYFNGFQVSRSADSIGR